MDSRRAPDSSPAALSLLCALLCLPLPALALDAAPAKSTGPLTSDLFLKTLEQPPEWKAAVLAEDPDIASPSALAIDEKGRVFVAETLRFRHGVEDNRFHLDWAKEDMAVQSLGDRLQIYRKYAPKKGGMEAFTKFSERVRILESKEGKWVSTVFAEGFNDPLDGTAGGVFAFKGDVWFSCIPSVWRLRDTEGTGVSNQRESIHRGFGIGTSISGHDLNGFAMGLDGRLYFSVGDRGYSLTTLQGAHWVSPTSGAVFRMEMDGSHLELVHRGLRNPKEVAFDRHGNLFSVDNNSGGHDRARIVHVVEGGDSGWDRGHENLSIFGSVWEHPAQNRSLWFEEGWWRKKAANRPDHVLPPADIYTQGPSGLTYFPGTGFPTKWEHMFLVADYAGRGEVKGFRMKPNGAGFELESQQMVLRGVNTPDIEFGYDGRLYVVDRKSTSFENKAGRLLAFWDPTHIANPEVSEVESLFRNGIETLPSTRLGELLAHTDMRVRLRAEWELSTRGADGRDPLLAATAPERPLLQRLHAAYGLGILARRRGDAVALNRVIELTRDAAPIVRARTAEMVGELVRRAGREKALEALLPLLEDSDAQVRMCASIAIGKTGLETALQPLLRVLEQNADADASLRHGAVMGLVNLRTPEKLTPLLSHPNVAVRRGVLLALRRFQSRAVEHFLNDPDPELVREAIQAIYDGRIVESYRALAKRTDLLGKWGPTLDNRLLCAQLLLGSSEEFQRLLAIASDAKQKLPARSEALWILRHWEKPLGLNPVTGSFDPKFAASRRDISPESRSLLASGLLSLASSENGEFLPEVLETLAAFQIDIPEAVKRAIFAGVKNPLPARLQALDSLGPVPDLLEGSLRDPVPEIRMRGLTWLLKQDEAAGLRQADERLRQGTLREQQNVIALLGGLPSEAASARLNALIQTWSTLPEEIRADLWTAVVTRKDCEEHLQKLRATLKDSGDSLSEFRAALSGGDPDRGRKLFYESPAAMCATCHAAEPGVPGGTAGPSLEKVAARGPEYLLRSVVEPSAEFAPGYAALAVTLQSGETLAGVLWKRDEQGVELKLADGKLRKISKGEIQKMDTPVSPMPPMGQILNLSQIRDVVAFLKTLTPENRDLVAARKLKPQEVAQRAAQYLDAAIQPR
ncbi:MAG: hypothetical protein RLZZ399_3001 [Verrucomicrobiota bacterium]|jgi:quinoprotein glucose dehydrogenase